MSSHHLPQVPTPVPGAPRRTGRGFVTSFGEQRACAEDGCTTTLSRYNPGTRCAEHDQTTRRT